MNKNNDLKNLSESDIERILDRSRKTEWDIFPLDRMFQINFGYKIFKDEYKKVLQKSTILKSRKYQRLHEIYFALFVAVTKSKVENKEHFLVVPKDPEHDVDLISVNDLTKIRPLMWRFPCDIKEYGDHSLSFDDFLKKSVLPKLQSSHVIVGIHKTFTFTECSEELIRNSTSKFSLWFVSGADNSKADVFSNYGGVFRNLPIDLNTDIPAINDGEAEIIFQDVLRNVPVINEKK